MRPLSWEVYTPMVSFQHIFATATIYRNQWWRSADRDQKWSTAASHLALVQPHSEVVFCSIMHCLRSNSREPSHMCKSATCMVKKSVLLRFDAIGKSVSEFPEWISCFFGSKLACLYKLVFTLKSCWCVLETLKMVVGRTQSWEIGMWSWNWDCTHFHPSVPSVDQKSKYSS